MSAPRTGLFHHPRCADHFAGPAHPERPERAARVVERLRASGLAGELELELAPLAPLERIHAVHRADYVRSVRDACAGGRALLDDGDTYVSSESYEAALFASGAALAAVDGVMSGRFKNAFVAVRPPGHHAEATQAMGFCLFNHVAIAARHLRDRHALARVAIVDWDVHHGNGTQHTFERDASVFYASLHQYPYYPGTGAASERGVGAGEGATLNCPMAAGTGDREWLAEFEGRVLPALEDFGPEFVLVSAGFDAHRDDPLSGTRMSEGGFQRMSEGLVELARKHAGGRVVSLLEGGYDLEALAASVEAHVAVLVSA